MAKYPKFTPCTNPRGHTYKSHSSKTCLRLHRHILPHYLLPILLNLLLLIVPMNQISSKLAEGTIETTGIEDILNLAIETGNIVAVVTVIRGTRDTRKIQETEEIIIPLLLLVTLLPHVIMTAITVVVRILIPVVAEAQDAVQEKDETLTAPLVLILDQGKIMVALILQLFRVLVLNR